MRAVQTAGSAREWCPRAVQWRDHCKREGVRMSGGSEGVRGMD